MRAGPTMLAAAAVPSAGGGNDGAPASTEVAAWIRFASDRPLTVRFSER